MARGGFLSASSVAHPWLEASPRHDAQRSRQTEWKEWLVHQVFRLLPFEDAAHEWWRSHKHGSGVHLDEVSRERHRYVREPMNVASEDTVDMCKIAT